MWHVGVWRKTGLKTLAANPIKLCILNSLCVNGFDGRCWKLREKHRRVLMMLRGGTAPFQIETGMWKGVPREERVCRECGTNEEIEHCNLRLLYSVPGGIQRDNISWQVWKIGSPILHF